MTIRREDLRNAHEEADVIIIHHVLSIVESSRNYINISVISDDTDVFVLFVHFYHNRYLTCRVTMDATSKQRTFIDIHATANLHKDIAGQQPAAHALSWCDTVAQFWGIGKTRVVKVLTSRQLSELGNSTAALSDVVQESTAFIAACYGYEEAATMLDVRFKMWKVKTKPNANIVSAWKLMSLPTTNESFQQNLLRAHLQCCIWKHADEANPPDIDPTMHVW